MNKIRLNKYIAQTGQSSRRKADELIATGSVKVNGVLVQELGVSIDPINDRVELDGQLVQPKSELLYFVFNKPKGVLTTMDDPKGRPTVKDFIEEFGDDLYPVGRLDWDTEGLILITNDGDFANRVTHPKWGVRKTYLAKLSGRPSEKALDKLLRGVTIVGGRVKANEIIRLKKGSDQYDWVRITISDGKNRQIRRMFEKIGFDVLKLQRIGIGGLRIGNLKKGQIKRLNESALRLLFSESKADGGKGKLPPKSRQKSLKRI
ncbi:MAG: rRNA pseudouridine synthase [Bdellovibrionales bacterium]|nr:rRNA pseudouridine synthase [Bdellovibrionales bacterium]